MINEGLILTIGTKLEQKKGGFNPVIRMLTIWTPRYLTGRAIGAPATNCIVTLECPYLEVTGTYLKLKSRWNFKVPVTPSTAALVPGTKFSTCVSRIYDEGLFVLLFYCSA